MAEEDPSLHPEIPTDALADFEKEIEQERKHAKLLHLGDTASEAASRLNAL